MVVFPNCKINLGLNITGKRTDGYHNLETVFFPVQIKDVLEIISSEEFQFTSGGIAMDINPEDNICIKAYHLLKKDFPELPLIKMHLHKAIPMGAGLGGGSADGAFTLKLLNRKFRLGLSTNQLIDYSLQIGSDCPFFIINKPCIATGRGEILEEIKPDLSKYKFVIVNPGIHINTAWAFTQLSPAAREKTIKQIIRQPVETWKQELRNDFEEPVFKEFPEIKSIKDELYKKGAVYASMSGSGSSVFGLFEKDKEINTSLPGNYYLKELPC